DLQRVAAREPGGVIDQSIEAAVPLLQFVEHAPNLIDALQVGAEQVGAAALFRRPPRFRFGLVIVNADPRSLLRESKSDAPADSLRRARDQYDLVFKRSHQANEKE